MSNIQMMIKISIQRVRLLDFLLFHIQWVGMQVLLNPWEMLVKEMFFNKISALQLADAIKTKLSCFLRTANLRNNSFLFTRQGHIHRMQNFLSETLYFQFNYAWCNSKQKQNGGRHKRRIHILVKFHDYLCLVTCLRFYQVNIFFIAENFGAHIFRF